MKSLKPSKRNFLEMKSIAICKTEALTVLVTTQVLDQTTLNWEDIKLISLYFQGQRNFTYHVSNSILLLMKED